MTSFRILITALAIAFQFTVFSAAAAAPAKSERILDRGYIVKTSKNRFFFMRNPNVIEPGVEIEARAVEKKNFCVLDKTAKIDCPIQEISFTLKKSARGALMTELRLEQDTPWHRLNRMQKTFAP